MNGKMRSQEVASASIVKWMWQFVQRRKKVVAFIVLSSLVFLCWFSPQIINSVASWGFTQNTVGFPDKSSESVKRDSFKWPDNSPESVKQDSFKWPDNSPESLKRDSLKWPDKSPESVKRDSLKWPDNSLESLKRDSLKWFSPSQHRKNKTAGFSSHSPAPSKEIGLNGISPAQEGMQATAGFSSHSPPPSKESSLKGLFDTSPTLGCSVATPRSHAEGTQPVDRPRLPTDRRLMYSNTCEPYYPPSTNKLILNLNRQNVWFTKDKHYQTVTRGCTYNACTLTDDIRLLAKADAVLVYICRQNRRTPPPRSSAKQIWVAFCMESPVHYRGFHDSPGWRNVFNWTMNYRTDSDVFYPYAFLSLRSGPSLKNFTSIALQKTRPIAWFVSNCHTNSKRDVYVRELRRYIDVDIYGRCSPKKSRLGKGYSCLGLMNTTYYFYLAFENSICRDYVTEKMFKLYTNVDAVPIARGGADYSRYFPPGTYLNTADYGSPWHLAERLKALMAEPGAYARLLENKDHFRLRGDTSHGHNLCELCRHLHNPGQPKMYPDIMQWTRENACRDPSDV